MKFIAKYSRKPVVALSVLMFLTLTVPDHAQAARKASMVIDGNTGKVLHSTNPDRLVYPASLTKMMTLFLLFDDLSRGKLSFSTRIRVSKNAAAVQPSKLGLKRGETITVRNAIKALITKSANDVAIAVAEHISGSEKAFAKRMTRRARQLGMRRTVFTNASGLPDTDQVTTARDVLKLGLALIDVHTKHYHLFAMRSFTYKGRRHANHNGLLRNYRGTDGLKTGYTRASGFNLVASVRRGGKHVIGAVFGGKSAGKRNRQMRKLLTKSFKRASPRKTRKFRQQRRDLIARVSPRRSTTPRLVQRTRRAQAPRRWNAVIKKNQPAARIKTARLHRSKTPAPPLNRRSSNPLIQVARVRTVRFGRQRNLPAVPPTPATGASYQIAAVNLATVAAMPRALPRRTPHTAGALRLQQPTHTRKVVAARQPSTFQRQAAVMNTPGPAQYSAPRRLRTAMVSPARSLTRPTRPDRSNLINHRKNTGGYQVQIGAYGTVREAEQQIKTVRASAGTLLNGFGTVTIPFKKANRRYFRARFSGFDNRTAASTCQELRRRNVECFIAKAR